LPLCGSFLQRLFWRLWLQRPMDRGDLFGVCRLHRKLLSVGPIPGPLDIRLLLTALTQEAARSFNDP
jgi:hypothetical protein